MNLKKLVRKLLLCFCCLIVLSTGVEAKDKIKTKLKRSDIYELSCKVADWELSKPAVLSDGYGDDKTCWVQAAFWVGLSEFYKCTKDQKYLDELVALGDEYSWEPGPFPYDANSHCIISVFADVYEITKDPKMIDKSRFMADMPIERWWKPTVKFKGNKYWRDWWSWCDALFMAPPSYARLGTVLNDSKYTDYMSREWWRTSDYLYNKSDSLYFRDDTFFDKYSTNGEHVYWSRGNGWVLAGLCRVLDDLPKDYPTRGKFEQQFREMATKIASVQADEGFWATSLLDLESFPNKETSGSAFYCYSLAWGVNNGLLDKEEFMPSILRGWEFLVSAVHSDGMLGYVQQIGDAPGDVEFDDNQSYGVGGFLLTAAEMIKLVESEK